MIDCLAIWWMYQGHTLQEDHVWWPAGAKLHGKVFSLSWKWVSGETPLDILEMSHLHYMFGKQHEWDGIYYVSKTCVDMKCKKDLGWLTKGLSTQRRDPSFLLNERILPRQMDKCYVTLAKNMHVKLLNSICRTCFFILFPLWLITWVWIGTTWHTSERGAHFSDVRSWKGFQYWLHPREWMQS